MKKKSFIISLIVIGTLGSLFIAFASNLLFEDVLNHAVPLSESTLFASIPAGMVAISLVLAAFYFIRLLRYPNCFKRYSRLYALLVIIFNSIGLVGVILSATIVYGNYFTTHPFPGYLVVFTIIHLILIASAITGLIFLKKLKDDTEKVKITPTYVFKTIGWFLFLSLAFNRFGTLLMMPIYVHLRTLYLTFPYYIWLMVPMFIVAIHVLHILDILDNKKVFSYSLIALVSNVILFTYIVIVGIKDSSFISALSQALPLERLTSMPLEIPVHFLSYLGVSIWFIVSSKKKSNQ